MDVKQRVQIRLKPKVKQFGFTKKVFRSVAAQIADKLDLEDDASDEDIDAKIDEIISVALPYISLIQPQANAQLDEWKKSLEKDDDDEDGDDDDDDESAKNGKKSQSNAKHRSAKSTKTADGDSAQSEAMERILDVVNRLAEDVKGLKGEKLTDSRRAKLETLLKDAGTFGKRTLKSFSKMKFEDDDEFDEFYSEVEEDLKALNQERADAGLSAMGVPPGGKGDKRDKKEEVFSDEEIDAMAD